MPLLALALLLHQGKPPVYLDPGKPPAARARDLVSRMTLDEKIGQMMHEAPAIPRLGVARYDWWSEALHGIARPGNVTVYPQCIGLGATFDAPTEHEMATQISDEARARYNYERAYGDQGWDQGLDFWAPNINIFRDPRWGRGQETYGEDPFLTGRMAVAYVTGIQGNDLNHLKAISTPKHYAVHSGPDPLRHQFNAVVPEREMWITYLPAFQAAIAEGNAWSIMASYNAINGWPATTNKYLLQTVLRDRWGFPGYVVSDCGAIDDIVNGHHTVKTMAEAAALAVKAGTDLECGDAYKALKAAVGQGLVDEKTLDRSVERLMEARIRLGMFDKKTRYDGINMKTVDSADHRATARKLADESIVLLKNEGKLLPLSDQYAKIAVIGPNGENKSALYGNYNGTNLHMVSIVDGIRAAAPNSEVTYTQGCGIAGLGELSPIPAGALKLRAEYFANQILSGEPAVVRTEATLDHDWETAAPGPDMPNEHWSARWTGTLTPPVGGRYTLGMTNDDGMRVWLDGKLVLDDWADGAARTTTVPITLEANHAYALKVEFYNATLQAVARLSWMTPNADPFRDAVAAAKAADVVVMSLGIDPDQEGEEHDRTSVELPRVQVDLLKAVMKTGRPVVVVYQNGGPLTCEWAAEHVPAIVEAWYPGEEGGDAVADVLFGSYNPAGRMPVTAVRTQDDLPPFDDYEMAAHGDFPGRTYRFAPPTPEYPFGYGLSYTTFAYSNLQLPRTLPTGSDLEVKVDVTNSGHRGGDEVVQLYLHHRTPSLPMPNLELKAFARVHLESGETKTVVFHVPVLQLSVVQADTTYADEPGVLDVSVGGGQPTDIGQEGPPSKATSTARLVSLPTVEGTVELRGPVKKIAGPRARS